MPLQQSVLAWRNGVLHRELMLIVSCNYMEISGFSSRQSHACRLQVKVGERDAEGMSAILSLAFFEGFQHKGRLAAVFELMKCNLRTALTKYGAGH